MNAAPSITQQHQTDKPFTCARCHQPSATAYMCEKCADATDPTRRKQSESLLWHEPKTNKDRRNREQREKKQRLKPMSELLREMEAAAEGRTLAPGWTERAIGFFDNEERYEVRLKWLDENWTREMEVTAWRNSLTEADEIRKWGELQKGGSIRPIFLPPDVLEIKSDAYQAKLSLQGDTPDASEGPDKLERKLKAESLKKFSAALYPLCDDDFAALQVRVHQLRAWRDHQTQRAYTSEDAAKALTVRLGHEISASAYRQRVKRLNSEFDFDLEVWVNYRYL